MTRWLMWKPLRLGGLFAVTLMLALAATVPLPVALAWSGARDSMGYASARGTVWGGRIEGVGMAGLDLGTVRLALRPLALLTGQWRLDWFAEGRAGIGRGRAERGVIGDHMRVSRTRFQLDLAQAPTPLPFPVLGQAWIEAERLQWQGRQCLKAEGQAGTDLLMRNSETLNWTGPRLRGPLACRNGRLVADLTGRTPSGGKAGLTLVLRPSGGGEGTLWIDSDDARLATALPALGFGHENDRYALTVEVAS